MQLLAFHLTWATYGTRLHGDARNTVDRQHNQYGEPVVGSIRWIFAEDGSYFDNAVDYVNRQRASE
jgi:hypothetical protein